MSGMAAPTAVDLTSTGDGYPHYSTCPRIDCHILGSHTHGAATTLPDAIEQIRAERDRLREENAEILLALRSLLRVAELCRYCTNADETDRAFEVLVKYTKASASPADLDKAGYFSPALSPSYGGTDE